MKKLLPGALKRLARACACAHQAESGVEAARAEVGQAIRHDRKQKKYSLGKFAEKVSVSKPYLSEIERGNHYPSDEVLERIKEGLAA